MDSEQYWAIFKRWWWLALIVAVIGAASGFVWTSRESASFTSTTRLLVLQQATPGITQLNDLQTSERLAATFAELVTLRGVLADAIETGELDISTRGLRQRLVVEAQTGTNLLTITATAEDREVAVQTSNAVAEAFVASAEAALASPVGVIRIVEPGVDAREHRPSATTSAAVGAILGLIVAAAIIAMAEFFDHRVRDTSGLWALGDLNTLGGIRSVRGLSRPTERLVMLARPHSRTAEEFRSLRTVVLSTLDSMGRARILQIASPRNGDGKTTVACNLAIAVALVGRRVALVDADLRNPMVAELFGLDVEPGLTDHLRDERLNLGELMLQTAHPNVAVLPAGSEVANPAELLGSSRMAAVLETLRDEYDIVIVDSPPLLAVADGRELAPLVQATALVVRLGRTDERDLLAVRTEMQQAGMQIAGVIINEATTDVAIVSGDYPARFSAASG